MDITVLPEEYFEKRVYLTLEEIQEIQSKRIRNVYKMAWNNVPFYRKQFKKVDLRSNSVKDITDINKLPFTTSFQLKRYSLEEFLAVSFKDICLIHTSSGTTGNPKVFPYTNRDIDSFAKNAATCYWMSLIRKEDNVLGAVPFGEGTIGTTAFLGVVMIGATYIPLSVNPGLTEKVIAKITGRWKFGGKTKRLDPSLTPSVLLGLPSFCLRIADLLNERGIRENSIKKMVVGGENLTESMRSKIEEKLMGEVYQMYGLGEFLGGGVAEECIFKDGFHILSDDFFAEVIDPQTGRHVRNGEEGELVLTSLNKEALPLFRYRTGDRTKFFRDKCKCGVAHQKIGLFKGRINQDTLMVPGGCKISMSFLEEIIFSQPGVGSEYIISIFKPEGDRYEKLNIAIEVDSVKSEKIKSSVIEKIYVEYRHKPEVYILPKGGLPKSEGKVKRIVSPIFFKEVIK